MIFQNQDIGFVAEGQEAVIKLDAFLFTRYGTVPRKIKVVSEDAVGGSAASRRHVSRCVALKRRRIRLKPALLHARVTLDLATMDVDGKTVRLTPDMAASVEIKAGKRKLIEFLLSPLRRMADESGRER
jgi:hemolysin D